MGSLDRRAGSLLQLGGICGMLAGVMLSLAYGLLTLGYPPHTCCTEQFFEQLPQFRTSWLIVQTLLVSAWALSIPLFLALYTSLRESRARYALLATVLGVLAASLAAIGLFLGTSYQLELAAVYAKATDVDKKILLTVAEVIQGSAASLLPVVFLSQIIVFLGIGAAMLRSTAFQKGFGGLSIILGIILIISFPLAGLLMFLRLWVPQFFALVIIPPIMWLILLGWEVYGVSRVG